jgi:hypothetical protein
LFGDLFVPMGMGAPHLARVSRDVGYHFAPPASFPPHWQGTLRFAFPTSRERRARYGAPIGPWRGEIQKNNAHDISFLSEKWNFTRRARVRLLAQKQRGPDHPTPATTRSIFTSTPYRQGSRRAAFLGENRLRKNSGPGRKRRTSGTSGAKARRILNHLRRD